MIDLKNKNIILTVHRNNWRFNLEKLYHANANVIATGTNQSKLDLIKNLIK